MSGQCSPGESDDAEKSKVLDTAPKVAPDAEVKVEPKLETKADDAAPIQKVEGQ